MTPLSHNQRIMHLIQAHTLIKGVRDQYEQHSDVDKAIRAAELSIELAWATIECEQDARLERPNV